MHSLQKRKKCATCSSNSVGGCQTHALHGLPRECQNVISSCDQWKIHGTWSSSADGQFLLETPREGGACQRHVVGGCFFKSGCDSDLANCTPSRTSWKCVSVGSKTFKFYGRPETVTTDPEGCFRERLFREWLASKNVMWDPQPAEAAWRTGILDKVLDVLKNAATRAAKRPPEDASCEALFDDCTEAHNELHRRRGYSPFQLLIGRSPPGLPLDGDKQLGEVSASLTSDGRHRLHIQRECYRAYLVEEMSLQQKRREMHKSRPFRVWSSGEWCWFWRSRAHLHRRTKASRQFKEGAFLGPVRVLLQECERKGDDLKYKAVVWIVDGDQLARCSSTHLRLVSTAEQTLCSLSDGEAQTFQQVVQELPQRNFVDLVGQPSPVEEDFEEPKNVASSDNELHEDFLSGDVFASAPVIQRCQKIRRCRFKHGPLHHMQRHQQLCHQNLLRHHSFPKSNRVHPQHVLLSHDHQLFHSHRHRNHQQHHRQTHHHIWNYLQSQCLSLKQ